MAWAAKSRGVALPEVSRASSNQMAKTSPAFVQDRAVHRVVPGAESHNDGFERVDRIVIRAGVSHVHSLHAALADVSNSPVTEHRLSGKGCASTGNAPRRTRTAWTEERVTLLGRLFDANLSHELIAQALGTSKGAVSGKLDRLVEADPERWTRSATIIGLKPDRGAGTAKPVERRAPIATEAPTSGVTLLELGPHMCRWPLAFTTEQTFCGGERALPSSYCATHRARSVTR